MGRKNELGIGMKIFVDLMSADHMFDIGPTKSKFSSGHLKDHYMRMIEEQPIYRIAIDKNLRVTTDCFDLLENFAPELEGAYDNVQALPQWVQDRLAVLMVLDPKQINDEIDGVGRRISTNVFWVWQGTGIKSYESNGVVTFKIKHGDGLTTVSQYEGKRDDGTNAREES